MTSISELHAEASVNLPPDVSGQIDDLLARANGRRRARTLSRAQIDAMIARAPGRDLGEHEVRHGGSIYGHEARSTVAMVAVARTGIYLGIGVARCPTPSPWSVCYEEPGRPGSYAWWNVRPHQLDDPASALVEFDLWLADGHPNVIRIFSYS